MVATASIPSQANSKPIWSCTLFCIHQKYLTMVKFIFDTEACVEAARINQYNRYITLLWTSGRAMQYSWPNLYNETSLALSKNNTNSSFVGNERCRPYPHRFILIANSIASSAIMQLYTCACINDGLNNELLDWKPDVMLAHQTIPGSCCLVLVAECSRGYSCGHASAACISHPSISFVAFPFSAFIRDSSSPRLEMTKNGFVNSGTV